MSDQAPSATLAIAASFTAEPLLPGLTLVLDEAGLNLVAQCAPYNQIFQELLAPSSLLALNAGGANLILLRVEDFLRDITDHSAGPALIDRTCREWTEALGQFARRARSPTVLALLPPSPAIGEALNGQLSAATHTLAQAAQRLPGMYLLTESDIDRAASGERYDPLRDELAHIPYTEEFYAALALAIGRKLHAILVPAHKVLVLDCDNTLWRGVIGEDGLQGIVLAEAMLQVQRFACRVQAAGGLICLVSKNAEADVLEVFAQQPSMLLKSEHIVAHRINWNSKAENIASLARELNLGLDSFVVLDDNPVECAQIQATLPQVVTLQLPAEPEIDSFLSHLWVFDKVAVTAEDLRRTALYRENTARQQLEEATTDLGAFIASLQLEVDIAPPDESEWPRLAQLTQRTNQFNFTTVRRNEAELRAAQSAGATVLRVRVKDRFGDYGLVGLALAKAVAGDLKVDTLLLSCRVLGRGVEHALIRKLGELASECRLAHVELPFVSTAKNEPAAAFADHVAAAYRLEERGQVVYRIPTLVACNVAHHPGHDPAAVINARRAEERRSTASAAPSVGANRSERYARLARTLTVGAALLEAVRSRGQRMRPLAGRPVQAATDFERQLLLLWQEVLNVQGLGVEDDYFALGGTSLLAARMFAEITRRFGVKLRLTTILDAPTVRALARYLAPRGLERSGVLIELKRGGSKNLFLVHDGDGETLLYRNLAQHMPDEMTVFGIEPRGVPQVPLAHTRIEDMARCYIAEVRARQPYGPYLLGGLCAGGVIAYEMALQLKAAGEPVHLVAILDAARPQARKRKGLYSKERARRLSEMFSEARRDQTKLLRRSWYLTKAVSRKLAGFTTWQVSSRLHHLAMRLRFRILHELLMRQAPWPAFLPRLSVRDIYDSAEARYVPRTLTDAGVLLVRARFGEGDDTPYREIYLDETFGWSGVAPGMEVVDVDGGHSSMLQEPFVASLATAMMPRLQQDNDRPCNRAVAAQPLQIIAV